MSEPLRVLDLFSGVGGFAIAAELANQELGHRLFETTQFVEIEDFCTKVLDKNFPGVPIHGDIRTFTAQPGDFDVICGGSPCQDISAAGKREGIKEGTRSGLFFELIRIVRLVRPRFVFVENVSNLLANGMDIVLREFSESGYDAEWSAVSCAEMGGVHLRERIWVVAYDQSLGLQHRQHRQDERQGYYQGNTPEDATALLSEWAAADTNGKRQRQSQNKANASGDGGQTRLGIEEPNSRDRHGTTPDSNSLGRDNGSDSQREHPDCLHGQWDSSKNQQSGSGRECGSVSVCAAIADSDSGGRSQRDSLNLDSQTGADTSSECGCAIDRQEQSLADSDGKGLEAGQRQSGQQTAIGESERSDCSSSDSNGCRCQQQLPEAHKGGQEFGARSGLQSEPEALGGFRQSDDGLPDWLARCYLMAPDDLPDCLPFATDTDVVPYRKEKLKALGNAIVPQVGMLGFLKIAELLNLRNT